MDEPKLAKFHSQEPKKVDNMEVLILNILFLHDLSLYVKRAKVSWQDAMFRKIKSNYLILKIDIFVLDAFRLIEIRNPDQSQL